MPIQSRATLSALLLFSSMTHAKATDLEEFSAIATKCAPSVAPETLASIVKVESGFNPIVIGVNGGSRLERQPRSKEEAVVTAKWLLANGYNIDLGYGQVNSANLPKIGLSVEDAFDGCKNLAASALILSENYKRAKKTTPDDQQALRVALSLYNTGSTERGFSNGYVGKVEKGALNLAGESVPAIKPIPLVQTKSGGEPPRPAPPKSARRPPAATSAEDVFSSSKPSRAGQGEETNPDLPAKKTHSAMVYGEDGRDGVMVYQ
ncbi:lytic transglycosylase domain-containing protein [Pseudomonas sp. DCB_CB]|uniref:lytic transglycosylase domain-containing protein n=1 Tax=unclassified Pseudomonas TaxID=196821 RepID=UPI0022489A73|nr:MULTISPECIES: lytic transglycosylase domain-containing protein [unclassified Pseudomonas]MCX2694521.1 lytic transglycosylase domain-containing protein [Pseudomonas sp. DCB_BZ]MCX2859649.1 lytic transglycosylase domain-containing protein [Pseudomonas sp. DCB_CB]